MFCNPDNFHIVSLSHCYPGKDKNGHDLMPPKECYNKWLKKELTFIDNKIYIFVGTKASSVFFLIGQNRKGNNHLYAYETAEIAKRAEVKQLVLTHFYPTIDKSCYLNEAKHIFPNTDVAEEGKVLKIVKSID